MTYEVFKAYSEEGYICTYDNLSINEVTDDEIYFDCGSLVTKEDFDSDYARIFEVYDNLEFSDDMEDIIKMLKKNIKELDKFDRAQGAKFTLLFQEGNILYEEEVKELFSLLNFYDRMDSLDLYVLKELSIE